MTERSGSRTCLAEEYTYVGGELELFRHVVNWKRYFRDAIKPFVAGRVLEVGAGIGGTTRLLCTTRAASWTALEPDHSLAAEFRRLAQAEPFAIPVDLMVGTVASLDETPTFDCMLYIDVLEHIEDDASELLEASKRLTPGGTMIVLSPAHQILFSPFDRAVGHFRRYKAASLTSVAPDCLKLAVLRYLDSVGMLVSLANRLLLKQKMPTAEQLSVWDRLLVPISQILDPICGYRLGKSVLAVWRKQ